MRALLAAFALLATPASAAEEIVADLSQSRIGINATFNGSEILIFGAIKRDAPIGSASDLDVIVTVAGPSASVLVRKKAQRAGIWLNAESVKIDSAPSFYHVLTTGPLSETLSATENLRHRISVDRMIRSVGASESVEDADAFKEALLRIRADENLYKTQEGEVTLLKDTLFRASVALPADLTEGNYLTRIFLTRNGAVVAKYETEIHVRKVGMERWLYTLAHEQPLIYGLLSLAIAAFAGWGASAIFRYIRS